MRLPVLIVFLVVSAGAVGVWSALAGAGWGVVLLRMVITLVAVQAVWFALVLIFGFGGRFQGAPQGRAPVKAPSDAARLDETP